MENSARTQFLSFLKVAIKNYKFNVFRRCKNILRQKRLRGPDTSASFQELYWACRRLTI